MDKADISFEKYYEDVLRFLRGLSRDEYLAEELAQETMYRAIKSIPAVDALPFKAIDTAMP